MALQRLRGFLETKGFRLTIKTLRQLFHYFAGLNPLDRKTTKAGCSGKDRKKTTGFWKPGGNMFYFPGLLISKSQAFFLRKRMVVAVLLDQ